MIIVDSSVLIDFLKGHDTAATDCLRRLEVSMTPFYLPAICCQEVMQGARDNKEWSLLKEYLETQRIVSSKNPAISHFKAARIYYDCRKKGITVRSTIDCYIAQLTIEHNGSLLHSDKDFEHITQVCKLSLFEI